jgi:uncharacterized membrane protein YdjX (TVP38/TMEM64 family)
MSENKRTVGDAERGVGERAGELEAALKAEPAAEPAASPPRKAPVSTADKIKFAGLVAFFLIVVIIGSVIAVVVVNSMGGEQSLGAELESTIREAGVFGILICLGIQFLQVVVAFIPGEVAQLAIGYVYGTLGGALITLTGVLISTVFVFYLARKLGAPFVQGMVGSKDSGRMKLLHNSKNLNALVFILYLIPGLPKDLFNYVFPLTEIRPSTFFVLSTIARVPAICASTFVAESFKTGNYLQMAIVAVVHSCRNPV